MSRRAKSSLSRAPRPPAASSPTVSRSGNPSPPEVQPHPRWQSFAACLFLALTVWVVFGQTLHHDFVNYDDNVYVYRTSMIVRGLSWDGVVWAFTHSHADNWHPLTTMSHMLDCQLNGLHPGGHHMASVLLHAATAMLLFLMLRNLTGAFWRSAFVAAVFAIHPLRVESVAWVSERKDVLSGLFFVLTLWAYTRYAQKRSKAEGREPGAKTAMQALDPRFLHLDYALALVFFALGLLSKPMLVTLPFVLLLLDYWPLNRFPHRASHIADHDSRTAGSLQRSTTPLLRLLLEKLPFLLLSAAACVATILSQKNAIGSLEYYDFPSRSGNALVTYLFYLWQMLYPAGLAVFYPHPGSHLSIWMVGLSLVILIILSGGVLAARRNQPCLLVGWLWYLGMLVPVIGLLQVGDQARADRYTYLPQIGVYMMVAWGAAKLCSGLRYRRAVLGSAAGVILAGLLAGAYAQTGYWKDSISLWTHTLACTSENYIAHNSLGLALAAKGRRDEAIEHYERALQLKPYNAEAHNNLGLALADQGKLKEAIEHYERALQLKPNNANAHNNLGLALADQGKLKEAIEHYERALQLKPDTAEAYNNLGIVLANQGKLEEAIKHFERARQLKPDAAEAHNNLGKALAGQGKLPEAIPHFQRALKLATAQNNTALAESIRSRLKSYEVRQ